MRTLISFATPEYRVQQERLHASAKPYFDEHHPYTPSFLPKSFYRENAKLFEYRRGFGYWCWKPWLLLQHLGSMDWGDELMYADSPCQLKGDPAPLFRVAERHEGIGIFHQKREKHKNSTWTKSITFHRMGCDEPKYWEGDNLLSTYSVWTKTDKSVAFVKEWFRWCQDYEAVSDDPCGITYLPGFKDHRHDQSIASLLAIKHNLFTMCDCSQWGEGYRCPECNYPQLIQTKREVIAPYLMRPTMSSCIEVSTTATCPLKCAHCPQDKLEEAYEGPKELTLGTFKKCLDNLVPGDAIYFSGFVEPCVAKDFMPMLRFALARSHRVQLYTTGRGLKVDDAREVAQSGVERITLHLADAYGHLGHSAGNLPTLEALTAHANVQVMAMDNEPHKEVRHLWDTQRQLRYTMLDRAGNLDNGLQLTQLRYDHKGPLRCSVAPTLDHSVILPDGKLAVCCCSYNLDPIIGDLTTTPYSEILRGKALNDFRKLQGDGDVICRKCAFAEKVEE